jgi:Flp pilus assembly protein TadG
MRDLIHGFRRARARLRRRLAGSAERGAIGVLVAVLVACGVLFGVGALVIDVGQLYQNRAELQNGADAAALAVAKSCIQGTCAPSIAAQYASANASKLTGGTAAVTLVCGSGALGTCPASTGQLTDCPANPPAGANYVDVHTATKLANGSTLLPPTFAGTLLGKGSYRGSTVLACAQAQWGSPLTATVSGVTISACEWDQATAMATTYAPPPPYPPNPLPSASLDRVLHLHGNNSGGGCPTEPAGADAPGNFGWTDDPNGNCTVLVSNNTYGGNTGNSASGDCQTLLYNAWSTKSLIFIPIYQKVTGTGTNAVYTLQGMAAFVITGYHMPSFSQKDWLNPANDCKGSSTCLNGYFTQGLIPATGALGGKNLGAAIIKLTG